MIMSSTPPPPTPPPLGIIEINSHGDKNRSARGHRPRALLPQQHAFQHRLRLFGNACCSAVDGGERESQTPPPLFSSGT